MRVFQTFALSTGESNDSEQRQVYANEVDSAGTKSGSTQCIFAYEQVAGAESGRALENEDGAQAGELRSKPWMSQFSIITAHP